MSVFRSLALPIIFMALVACQAGPETGSGPGGFGMKVMFLDGSGAPVDFPDNITRLTIRVTPHVLTDPAAMCDCSGGRCVKTYEAQGDVFVGQQLDDLNNDGAFEEAVIENVPSDCPFALEVLAYQGYSPKVSYYGRIDGLRMPKGRRLFLKLMLYSKINSVVPLDSGWGLDTHGVFGHTATRLDRGRPAGGERPDFRVIIAGGFDRIEPAACADAPIGVTISEENCPAPNRAEDCFKCFIAYATDDLYIFEQGSSTLRRPVQYQQDGTPVSEVRLSHPRAFHTATLLGDGRILLAGGMDRAAFVFRNNDILDTDASDAGWEIAEVKPLPGGEYLGALSTFDLFNGEFNPDPVDADRDGDFERGGLQDISGMQPMSMARAFQAASLVPGQFADDPIQGTLVLLFGGINADPSDPTRAPRTVDLFEAGGNGFSGTTFSNLAAQRAFPAASWGRDAAAGKNVLWVFGGMQWPGDNPTPNSAVAEKWTRNDITHVLEATPISLAADSPQLVRLFARALPLTDDGVKIMLAGWYGARCSFDAGTETPTFVYENPDTGDPIPTHICSAATVSNNMIVDLNAATPTFTAVAQPPSVQASAMGSTIMLGLDEDLGTRKKWILQSGGVANTGFTVSTMAGRGSLVVYKPVYTPDNKLDTYNAVASDAFSATMGSPRMWHQTVELKGGNVLVVGGVKFELDSDFATIIEDMEMVVFEGLCGDGTCEQALNSVSLELGTCNVDCNPVP
jgi:hypothetical protein